MQQGSKRPTFMVPRSTTDIRILWFSKAVLGPLKLVRHPEAPATVPRVRPGPSTPMTAGPLRPAHDAPLGLAVAVKFTASAVPRRLPWPSRSEG